MISNLHSHAAKFSAMAGEGMVYIPLKQHNQIPIFVQDFGSPPISSQP
jgi:hypothetical protein